MNSLTLVFGFSFQGSGPSEELKPSCLERNEHMDSDDGQMEHECINPLHSEENSDVLLTKSFPEGNVVVQPEPKKEDKDDFQEPEVGHKSKMETKTSKRHVGERLHEIVCCTACGQQVNHYEDSVYRHPALNVLICKSCYIYTSDDIRHDSTRPHKHCRVAGLVTFPFLGAGPDELDRAGKSDSLRRLCIPLGSLRSRNDENLFPLTTH
ncbi:transcriptional regulator ATRX-like isoform 3-T4 [Sarcophilus harrisii]